MHRIRAAKGKTGGGVFCLIQPAKGQLNLYERPPVPLYVRKLRLEILACDLMRFAFPRECCDHLHHSQHGADWRIVA